MSRRTAAPRYLDERAGRAPSFIKDQIRRHHEHKDDLRRSIASRSIISHSITSYPSKPTDRHQPSTSEYARLCMQGVNLVARGSTLTDIHPGMIINSAVHEEDFRHTSVPAPDKISGISSNIQTSASGESRILIEDITFSRYGPIHSEWRYMIVVALFCDHYLAIPCYTHGGRGADDRMNAQEYLPVSQYSNGDPRTLIVSSWTAHRAPRPRTAAHVTRPVTRTYSAFKIHTKELEKTSANVLVQSFAQHMDIASSHTVRGLDPYNPSKSPELDY